MHTHDVKCYEEINWIFQQFFIHNKKKKVPEVNRVKSFYNIFMLSKIIIKWITH